MATDTYPDTERFPLFTMEAVVAGVVFGFLFAAGYVGYSLWFEAAIITSLQGNGPSLSYGQPAGVAGFLLVSLGVSVGVGFAKARCFSLFWGAMLPAFCSFGLAVLSWLYWQDSIARYGHDSSDWIVFVPPLVVSIVVHGVSLIVAMVAVGKRFVCRR